MIKRLLALTAALAAGTILALAGVTRAGAQSPFPGGQGAGGLMTMLSGLSTMDTSRMEPTRNVIGFLLQRDDVRTAIRLESRQREKLQAFDVQQQEATQRTLMDTLKKVQSSFAELQTLPQEEQQAKMQDKIKEVRTQATETFQTLQDDQEKGLSGILRPDQIARLHELDLQWRGPMALGNKKLAETLGLTKEENAAIETIINEYRQALRAAYMKTMPANLAGQIAFAGGGAAPPAADPGAPNKPKPEGTTAPKPAERPAPQLTPEQQQEQSQKNIEKARKTAGSKILKALTPEHAKKWDTALGKLLEFRLIN